MTDQIKIQLGGKEFTVQRLDVGQLRELGIGAARATVRKASLDPAEAEAAAWDRWIEIILLGIGPDHPETKTEDILRLKTTLNELTNAVNRILDFTGLEPGKTEQPPGEPEAAGSTGAGSTAA
jgi:hypothetical protein